MKDFSFNMPSEIVIGEGKINEIAEYVLEKGKNCFLVVDPYFCANGFADEIIMLLAKSGISTTLFSDVKPNPDCREVDEGARVCKEAKCDVILAVGGGSAIDSGKAIGVVARNGGSSWDYVYKTDRAAREIVETIPLLAIPTTAGTGTEATQFAVLSNPNLHEKGTIINNIIFPDYAIIDPQVMKSMPSNLTALTGIDALAHCIEAFLANIGTPYSKMIAAEGIKTIIKALPEAYANGNNMSARKSMAWGSCLGGIAIGHAGVGLPHALGQPVGGIVNAPHGGSVAACLPVVIEFSFMSSFDLFAGLSEYFDPSVSSLSLYARAEKSSELVRRFFKYLDCEVKFSDYGMQEKDIDKATEVVFGGYLGDLNNHPRIANVDDVKALYKKCL